MLLRRFLNDATYSPLPVRLRENARLAVVDPHADLADDYFATAAALGAPLVAVFERT